MTDNLYFPLELYYLQDGRLFVIVCLALYTGRGGFAVMHNLPYLQDDSNVPVLDETIIDIKKSIGRDKTRRERMRKNRKIT